jgi:thiol-disulfide isomerase/thioredoxin
MTATTYNAVSLMLGVCLLIALGFALASFVLMLARWKRPVRSRYATRLFIALAAAFCLAGLHQAMLYVVFLPALGREQRAQSDAAHAKRLAETSFVGVGDRAPEFSLTTADGEPFALPNDGRITLINFFATWCGPCQSELPHLDRIWKANRDNERFRLLVIGREETTEAVREYRDKKGFTFPIAADPDRAVYALFASESIPRTLLVSPRGEIVYSQSGFREADIDKLQAALDAQIANLK